MLDSNEEDRVEKQNQEPHQPPKEEKKDAALPSEPFPADEACVVEITQLKAATVRAETPAEPARAPPSEKTEESPPVRAAYEHPLPIRITHWVNAISLFVLIGSGLRIFRAFPSFGPKIPEKVLLDVPKSLTLGGWLGGALQWHFTFMWFFVASGVFYLAYQIFSGHYRTVMFMPRDIPGVWPMIRHYFSLVRNLQRWVSTIHCKSWLTQLP